MSIQININGEKKLKILKYLQDKSRVALIVQIRSIV